jgi:putative membrane protein
MGAGLMWIIFLAILVIAVYLIVRSARQGQPGETPLDILKMRYAKGEITKEEFEQKKKDLGL